MGETWSFGSKIYKEMQKAKDSQDTEKNENKIEALLYWISKFTIGKKIIVGLEM
jgi:hypothetical protein